MPHTGGGGGNFGVVTRYLMRTAGAPGREPSELLPKAPAALLSRRIVYDWKTIGQAGVVMAAAWSDPAEDAKRLTWLRKLYAGIYQDTGGVPVPNAINAGSYINYPDVDLADSAYNKSGVPWHDLYYLGNCPRLQQIKAKWTHATPVQLLRGHGHPHQLPR